MLITGLLACGSNKEADLKQDKQPVEAKDQATQTDSLITLEGSYESIKGVMKNLSCYCYDAGYLTFDTDEEVGVCFDEMDGDGPGTCEHLTVKGYFKDVTIDPKPTNPCPAGTKKIFIATSYSCE